MNCRHVNKEHWRQRISGLVYPPREIPLGTYPALNTKQGQAYSDLRISLLLQLMWKVLQRHFLNLIKEIGMFNAQENEI